MRLTKNPPAPWTLIGAHMVAVHGWALGREPIRTSLDADVLVDVRLVTAGTAVVSQALVRDGFELVDYSVTGVGHTFAAGDVRFDVLAPDNVGQRASLETIRGSHGHGARRNTSSNSECAHRDPIEIFTRNGASSKPSGRHSYQDAGDRSGRSAGQPAVRCRLSLHASRRSR